jgi:hypothetical protein
MSVAATPPSTVVRPEGHSTPKPPTTLAPAPAPKRPSAPFSLRPVTRPLGAVKSTSKRVENSTARAGAPGAIDDASIEDARVIMEVAV